MSEKKSNAMIKAVMGQKGIDGYALELAIDGHSFDILQLFADIVEGLLDQTPAAMLVSIIEHVNDDKTAGKKSVEIDISKDLCDILKTTVQSAPKEAQDLLRMFLMETLN